MSNTRYMEPATKLLFEIVKQDAPQDEQQAKQMADEAKEYIEAIPQLEAIYHRLSKKIKLDNEVSLDAIDEDGATFLAYACEKGHLLIVQALLAARASPDKAERTGAIPLIFAAEKGHTLIVQTLLTAKASPNKCNEKTGATPLAWAAYEGHALITEALLLAKADPNKIDEEGGTPLFLASQEAHILSIQALLSAKADPNNANENKEGNIPLGIAVQEGHTSVVQALLTAKADPNKASANDVIPLRAAASRGYVQITQWLLEAKADPNKASTLGSTPLTLAAEEGNAEVVQLLLEAKADPNKARKKTGTTPLMFAVKHTDIVDMLLDTNAWIDFSNLEDKTALDYAIDKKKLEAVNLLLKKQASIRNPKALFDFLMSYDPRDPDVLFCLNVLSQQQNNLHKLNMADATQLKKEQYQALEQYRNQLSQVSESFSRKALNEAVGKILPPPLVDIICKLDAPLYRLNNSPVLFNNKQQIDQFREELTKKYNESFSSKKRFFGWF